MADNVLEPYTFSFGDAKPASNGCSSRVWVFPTSILQRKIRVCGAQRSNKSPSGAFKRQNGLRQQMEGPRPDKFHFYAKESRLCKPCAETPPIRANVQTVCRKCAAAFLHNKKAPHISVQCCRSGGDYRAVFDHGELLQSMHGALPAELIPHSFGSNKKAPHISVQCFFFLVEITGIEPVTSCMPCKRSPS